MKKYKLSELAIVSNKFKNIFNKDFKEFYDETSSKLMKKICIDIFSFDTYLHKVFGDYEYKNMSMEEIIQENLGEEAKELINDLL